MLNQRTTEKRYIPTNQLLAEYFSSRTEQLPFEETSDEFVLHLHIPKSSLFQCSITSNAEKNIKNENLNKKELSAKAKKILALAGSWADDDEDIGDYFSSENITNRRQSSSREKYL